MLASRMFFMVIYAGMQLNEQEFEFLIASWMNIIHRFE